MKWCFNVGVRQPVSGTPLEACHKYFNRPPCHFKYSKTTDLRDFEKYFINVLLAQSFTLVTKIDQEKKEKSLGTHNFLSRNKSSSDVNLFLSHCKKLEFCDRFNTSRCLICKLIMYQYHIVIVANTVLLLWFAHLSTTQEINFLFIVLICYLYIQGKVSK